MIYYWRVLYLSLPSPRCVISTREKACLPRTSLFCVPRQIGTLGEKKEQTPSDFRRRAVVFYYHHPFYIPPPFLFSTSHRHLEGRCAFFSNCLWWEGPCSLTTTYHGRKDWLDCYYYYLSFMPSAFLYSRHLYSTGICPTRITRLCLEPSLCILHMHTHLFIPFSAFLLYSMLPFAFLPYKSIVHSPTQVRLLHTCGGGTPCFLPSMPWRPTHLQTPSPFQTGRWNRHSFLPTHWRYTFMGERRIPISSPAPSPLVVVWAGRKNFLPTNWRLG